MLPLAPCLGAGAASGGGILTGNGKSEWRLRFKRGRRKKAAAALPAPDEELGELVGELAGEFGECGPASLELLSERDDSELRARAAADGSGDRVVEGACWEREADEKATPMASIWQSGGVGERRLCDGGETAEADLEPLLISVMVGEVVMMVGAMKTVSQTSMMASERARLTRQRGHRRHFVTLEGGGQLGVGHMAKAREAETIAA